MKLAVAQVLTCSASGTILVHPPLTQVVPGSDAAREDISSRDTRQLGMLAEGRCALVVGIRNCIYIGCCKRLRFAAFQRVNLCQRFLTCRLIEWVRIYRRWDVPDSTLGRGSWLGESEKGRWVGSQQALGPDSHLCAHYCIIVRGSVLLAFNLQYVGKRARPSAKGVHFTKYEK